MLPAGHGDSILLEYGAEREVAHRVLVDGGTAASYRDVRTTLLDLPPSFDGHRHLDLVVITHVDGDHIEGIVKLLQDEDLALRIGDVWFNDYQQLVAASEDPMRRDPVRLGPAAGEFLGALIEQAGLSWNAAFDRGPVMVPRGGPLLSADIGKMRMTVVSPSPQRLEIMQREWGRVIRDAGFEPGDRDEALRQFAARRWAKSPPRLGNETIPGSIDNSEANGSSIALVAEYGGIRLLLGADAHPDVLREGLERWSEQQPGGRTLDGRVHFDAYKVSHHGSKKNTTPQLLAIIDTPTYLISTDGKHFDHPDPAAIRMIIDEHQGEDPPVLRFNYETDRTRIWATKTEASALYGTDATIEWETE